MSWKGISKQNTHGVFLSLYSCHGLKQTLLQKRAQHSVPLSAPAPSTSWRGRKALFRLDFPFSTALCACIIGNSPFYFCSSSRGLDFPQNFWLTAEPKSDLPGVSFALLTHHNILSSAVPSQFLVLSGSSLSPRETTSVPLFFLDLPELFQSRISITTGKKNLFVWAPLKQTPKHTPKHNEMDFVEGNQLLYAQVHFRFTWVAQGPAQQSHSSGFSQHLM